MNSFRKLALAGALAGATAIGAVAGMTMLGTAGAQTSTTTPATGSQTAPTAPTTGSGTPTPGAHGQGTPPGPHQANGKTEAALSGDDLAKVTAGVESAVPGATIDRAETDADGDAFEAHITKADGTKATVKFDESFNVTSVVDGMA